MKTFKSKTGLFKERPYYTQEDVELMCTAELRETDLYPRKPEPVRIDRFIEKRFNVSPDYQDLPEGVLGWTRFGSKGVDAIIVARSLGEAEGVRAERVMNSTLGHEAGHGLLHAHLFALGLENRSLFPKGSDVEPSKILCRDSHQPGTVPRRGYDGRWWELQANMAMAALLLPRGLVELCLSPLMKRGTLGAGTLDTQHREEAVQQLAGTFNVSQTMARIRVTELFPSAAAAQLTL